MQIKIKKSISCMMMVALTLICVMIFINFLKPYYVSLLDKPAFLEIVATGSKSENALANNVRVSHIKVNGTEVNLSTVELEPGSSWQYESRYDHISAYDIEEEEKLCVPIDEVHKLEITFIEETGSGIVEVNINNKSIERIDLYRNVGWAEETFAYNVNALTDFDRSPVFWTALFIVALGCWIILFYKRKVSDEIIILGCEIVPMWILSFIIVVMALVIQYGEYSKLLRYLDTRYDVFIRTIILVFLLFLVISRFLRKLWVCFGGMSIGTILLLIINETKIQNRGTPLLPWDLSMTKEMFSVIGRYEIYVSQLSVVCLTACVGITILLFLLKDHLFYVHKFSFHTAILVISVGVLIFKGSTFFQDIENYKGNMLYQIDEYYRLQGFIPAFTDYHTQLNVSEKPKYYSKSTMEDILKDIRANCDYNKENHTPNIIAIMDESFWDAERLDTISFNEELLPNYESLKAESIYGDLFTHVLSGGTVTSEFEFLTGFSGEFFPEDYMVYGNFLDDDFPSVISVLEEQGYRTTAIHPYFATNYNRENAYQKLGFDDCFFDEDFENAKMIRGYISDESAFEKIEEEFEKNRASDQPQFIFTVTMQNHGGYWEEQTYSDSVVRYTTNHYSEVAEACMTDYFSGLHESDRALGELIDYFRNVDEDTIIVFFGDHMSDAGPKDDRMFAKTEWKNNTYMYDYETHVVPFLVWSNFDSRSEDWGIMEVGELLPSVFDTYGIACSDFWNFLIEKKKYYAAIDQRIVVNSDGAYTKLSELTEEQTNVHEIYRLLQYDCIWGENYASDLWSVHAQ